MSSQTELQFPDEVPRNSELERWQNRQERRDVARDLVAMFDGLDQAPGREGKRNLIDAIETFLIYDGALQFVKDWLRRYLVWPKAAQIYAAVNVERMRREKRQEEEQLARWKAEAESAEQSCSDCKGTGCVERDGPPERCRCAFGQELPEIFFKPTLPRSTLRRAAPSNLPTLLGIRPVGPPGRERRGRRR